MEKSTKGKIKLVFLPIVLVLALFSISFFFPASQSFHFLFTVPILLLAAVFLVTLTKKKGFPDENLVREKVQKKELEQLFADVIQTEAAQQSEAAQKHEQQIESHPDSSLPSDSESCTGSSMDESSDPDHSKDPNLGISDSSLVSDNDDDEDSLIEIDLPIGDFSGLSEEPKQKLLSKLPDFLPESIFKQQDLVELLAEINEMNEDESLIEIDISMGSTRSQDQKLM
ncbi:hypothetical protein L6164_031004 [Bauhinia variegata]|uniref:Uncharacterized protein n=1 Tax=Bauhinia variegata TaxID=167791 RepID=A0ACB9LFE1_BAUVA|nr:hypothetical protein L6164_031004 [Bauhinia variegata]